MQGAGETGFYGKMPAQGDFVCRRLASVFVQPWDAWLQACIAHNRSVFGGEWERLYRDAPVWRFLLAPGICGTAAWAGLVQPSIDRVGRHFPLTVAAELPSDVEVLDTMARGEGWFDAVERVAALTFANEITLEGLEARLSAVVFPEAAIVHADSAEDTLPIAQRAVDALKIGCPTGSDLYRVGTALRDEQVIVGHSHCVWFDASAEGLDRVVLVTRTLPAPAQARALFDGDWLGASWPVAKSDARLIA